MTTATKHHHEDDGKVKQIVDAMDDTQCQQLLAELLTSSNAVAANWIQAAATKTSDPQRSIQRILHSAKQRYDFATCSGPGGKTYMRVGELRTKTACFVVVKSRIHSSKKIVALDTRRLDYRFTSLRRQTCKD